MQGTLHPLFFASLLPRSEYNFSINLVRATFLFIVHIHALLFSLAIHSHIQLFFNRFMPTFASLLHTSIRSFAVNTTASSKPYPVSTMHTASLDNSSRNTHTTAQDACANVASSAPIQFSSGVQPISIQRHYTQAVEVGLRIDLGADSIKGAQMNPFCSWRTPESRIGKWICHYLWNKHCTDKLNVFF